MVYVETDEIPLKSPRNAPHHVPQCIPVGSIASLCLCGQRTSVLLCKAIMLCLCCSQKQYSLFHNATLISRKESCNICCEHLQDCRCGQTMTSTFSSQYVFDDIPKSFETKQGPHMRSLIEHLNQI